MEKEEKDRELLIMDIYEFLMLPEPKRYQYVWDHGTYLMHGTENGIRFALYHCGKFFCEVRYNSETNAIEGITPFKSISKLHQYADHISLSHLL